MSEKSDKFKTWAVLILFIVVYIVLSRGIGVLHRRKALRQDKNVQTFPEDRNNLDRDRSPNPRLADKQGIKVPGITKKDKNAADEPIYWKMPIFHLSTRETYIDTPTERFPRIVSSGLFPLGSSVMKDFESEGRGFGDMRNVAVLIESTNWNDTNRWITSLTAQRKSENDLRIYIFTNSNQGGVSHNFPGLKTGIHSRVIQAPYNDLTSAKKHALKYKQYVVSVKDYEHVAPDFADFYYAGKAVMELDRNIESVCGGSNGIWQNADLGDLLWLSQSECQHGEMISRRSSKTTLPRKAGISIRPEVARVGSSERSVVKDNSWNIDKIDPSMITKDSFETRLRIDIANADHKKKAEWDLLSTFDCADSVYSFPYENNQDLQEYFPNVNIADLHEYDGIYPLSLGNCRAYIIPAKQFQ